MKRIIFTINKFFATRKINKDRNNKGVWSDKILCTQSGKCISEEDYLHNVLSEYEKDAGKKDADEIVQAMFKKIDEKQ